MTYIALNREIGIAADRHQMDCDRAQARRRKFLEARKAGRAWLDATHEFRLRVGDSVFPRAVSMTGREAKEKNLEFEDAYHDGKHKRLQRWVSMAGPEPKAASRHECAEAHKRVKERERTIRDHNAAERRGK